MTLVLVEIGEFEDGRLGLRLSGTVEDLRPLGAHLGEPVAVVPLVAANRARGGRAAAAAEQRSEAP
ncbi:MAG: hypothetical protein BWX69_03068 [Planctomycetes bacterium ADurb.Bin069]|nr:MAG: hypothetical protein BWX69_03068 [Planctomycetes bacterium ADurb.Bin069]